MFSFFHKQIGWWFDKFESSNFTWHFLWFMFISIQHFFNVYNKENKLEKRDCFWGFFLEYLLKVVIKQSKTFVLRIHAKWCYIFQNETFQFTLHSCLGLLFSWLQFSHRTTIFLIKLRVSRLLSFHFFGNRVLYLISIYTSCWKSAMEKHKTLENPSKTRSANTLYVRDE